MNKKFYGLDYLRTLAITFVFVYHYGRLFPHPDWTNKIGKFGWTGVDLFFVLSGYLIASQLFSKIAEDKKISLKEFFLKRFFRIIPPYLVVVAIYFLFPYVHEREALAPLWKYLTFTQNMGLDLKTQGTFSHAWSLCIEEHFYLLFPLILVILVENQIIKKGFWILLSLFCICFAIRFYAYENMVRPHFNSDELWIIWYKWIYYPSYCRFDGLIIGVSIAAMFQFLPSLTQRLIQYGNWFLALSICILVGGYFICLDEISFNASIFGFPLVALGYGFMVLGAISSTSFLYNLNSKPITYIATLSYGIYLTHKFVIRVTQDQLSKIGIDKNSNLMLLFCIITVIITAILLNKLIEIPSQKIRDRILSKNTSLSNQN